jgi:hypothetical protein
MDGVTVDPSIVTFVRVKPMSTTIVPPAYVGTVLMKTTPPTSRENAEGTTVVTSSSCPPWSVIVEYAPPLTMVGDPLRGLKE